MKIELELSNANDMIDFQIALKKLSKGIRQVNFVLENGGIESYKSFPEVEYCIHSKMNDSKVEPLKNKK